jgi:hypothetical protein
VFVLQGLVLTVHSLRDWNTNSRMGMQCIKTWLRADFETVSSPASWVSTNK